MKKFNREFNFFEGCLFGSAPHAIIKLTELDHGVIQCVLIGAIGLCWIVTVIKIIIWLGFKMFK